MGIYGARLKPLMGCIVFTRYLLEPFHGKLNALVSVVQHDKASNDKKAVAAAATEILKIVAEAEDDADIVKSLAHLAAAASRLWGLSIRMGELVALAGNVLRLAGLGVENLCSMGLFRSHMLFRYQPNFFSN